MSSTELFICFSVLLCFYQQYGLACTPASIPCTGDCVHGGWSDWTLYTTCSVTSGLGKRLRTRTCTNPAPANGGDDCDGSDQEVLACSGDDCTDYEWSVWSEWTACSVTCGSGGVQTRTRTCTCTATGNPAANATESCGGDSEERTDCTGTVAPCPVHGGWSNWTDWTSCPVTCGGGQLWRERDCTNPAPANGGDDCVGNTHETAGCAIADCPANATDSTLTSREIIILSTLLPLVLVLLVTLAVFITLWRGAKSAAAVHPTIGVRQGPSTMSAGPIPPQAAGGSDDMIGPDYHPFEKMTMKKPPPYSP